jgi:hypothetical protein
VLTGKGYSPSEFPGNCILPVTSGKPPLLAYRNILNADYSGVKIVDKLRPLIVIWPQKGAKSTKTKFQGLYFQYVKMNKYRNSDFLRIHQL